MDYMLEMSGWKGEGTNIVAKHLVDMRIKRDTLILRRIDEAIPVVQILERVV